MRCMVVRYDRPHIARATSREAGEVQSALARLPAILPARGWILSGGLAVEAHAGVFARRHHDVDICVHAEAFEDVIQSAERHHYSLVQRVFWLRLFPGIALYFLRDLSGLAASNRGYHRLMLVCPSGLHNRCLGDLIDISVYLEKNRIMVRHDGRVRVPVEEWSGGWFDVGQSRVPLADLRHLLQLKRRRRSARDRADRRIIERLIRMERGRS